MVDLNKKIITIDGPSGTGKGTISRILADKLDWELLDSGALYRLVALDSLNKNIDFTDEVQLVELALQLPVVFNAETNGGETQVFLSGEDVSLAIRAEEIGERASKIAAIQSVRDALLQRQRDFASDKGLVADGRDMGTTVFPDSALKIYLTASASARAERRRIQLQNKGIHVIIDRLYSGIVARDERDASRTASPLRPAEDAIQIDTTHIGIDEVSMIIDKLVDENLS